MSVIRLKFNCIHLSVLISRISENQFKKLMSHSRKINETLETIWYHHDETIKNIIGVDSWLETNIVKRYQGLYVEDKDRICKVVQAMKIYIDGLKVDFNPTRINCRFADQTRLPLLKDDQLYVCHGTREMHAFEYILKTDSRFDPGRLALLFQYDVNFDYLLTDIFYDRKKVESYNEAAREKEFIKLKFSIK